MPKACKHRRFVRYPDLDMTFEVVRLPRRASNSPPIVVELYRRIGGFFARPLFDLRLIVLEAGCPRRYDSGLPEETIRQRFDLYVEYGY